MKLLTGQTEKQFNKWFLENYYTDVNSIVTDEEKLSAFYGLDFSMQSGVYNNFFDSLNIYIGIEVYRKKIFNEYDIFYKFNILNIKLISYQNTYTKRLYALLDAIKEVDKIYNN